jgi:hypothetical protein
VEHLPEGLGAFLVESGVDVLGSRGAGDEGVEATLVEGSDGIAHRLGGASEVFGYLRGRQSSGAGQKDLATTHHEGIFGAQPGFEPFALLFRQFPDKNWRFHERNYSPLHTTLSEDALGRYCSRCMTMPMLSPR